jgi:adhesin/invasin
MCLSWIACTQKTPTDPTEKIRQNIPILALIEATPEVININGDQSLIQVRLIDENANALSNKVITFSTTLGSLSLTIVSTDSNGYAHTYLKSGITVGEAKITATHGTIASISTTVNIIKSMSSEVAQIILESEQSEILANGIDETVIEVSVIGDSAQAIPGATVRLSSTFGTLFPSQFVTDYLGRGFITLTSDTSSLDVMAIVTAMHDTIETSNVNIICKAVEINIEADPTEILADGNSTSTIQVTLKEKTSLIAISNGLLKFATDRGLIANQVLTDTRGVGRVSLTSGTKAGTANVVIRYGKLRDRSVQVEFLSKSDIPYSLTPIVKSASAILANGVDPIDLSVSVLDENQNPVPGDSVRFTSTRGNLQSEWIITDINGKASTSLIANASSSDSSVVITALRGGGIQSVSTTASFEGIEFKISANPNIILADGIDRSEISVVLKRTTSKVAIPNAVITFGTDLGTIPSQALTNSSGIAQVFLTSETTVNTAHIIASYGSVLERNVDVIFQAESAKPLFVIELKKTSDNILANGIDKTNITATVVDSDVNPVSGVLVGFNAKNGQIAATASTDADGKATTELTSSASFTDVTDTVTAVLGGGSSLATTILYEGIQFELGAAPLTIIADGENQSKITAVLKHTTSKVAISGAVITFATDLGTIASQATTNSSGIADVFLTSGTTVGTAHVVASYGSTLEKNVNVTFGTESGISVFLDDLSVGDDVILANGIDKTNISATVVDSADNPVSDVSVLFSANYGQITSQATTNTNGIATVELTSLASFVDVTETVIAVLSGGGSLQKNVLYEGIQFDLEADPLAIVADGESQSTVTVILKRTTNNVAIPNAVITFATDLGTIPSQAVTNSSGIAKVSLVSSTYIGTARIVASYGSTLEKNTDIFFQAESDIPIFLDDLNVENDIILANGIDKTNISATVVDSTQNPVSGVSVVFLANNGQISSPGITNANGVATVELISPASFVDVIDTVTAVLAGGGSLQETVLYEGIQFDLDGDPLTIIADGESQSSLTAILKRTTNKVAIQGAVITFATDLGTIPSQAVTNSSGIATVSLTSGTVAGTAHVDASYGSTLEKNLDVTFQAKSDKPVFLVELEIQDDAFLSNGKDKTNVTVEVVDVDFNPASDVTVNFNASSGQIDSVGVTNSNGIATVELTSVASFVDVTSTVTANITGGNTLQKNVLFEGIEFTIEADPLAIIGDGERKSTISVILKRTTSKVAISNALITFGSDLGTIPSEAITNSAGIAEVSLTSSKSVGTTHVVASYGSTLERSIDVFFQSEPDVPLYLLDLEASEDVVLANGVDKIDISVTVVDSTQSLMPNVPVVFSANSGQIDSLAYTDANGIATVELTSLASFVDVTDTVTAILAGGGSVSKQILYEGIQFELRANPQSIIADGISTSNIIVTLKRTTSKTAIINALITFGTDLGTIIHSTSTNLSGVASVTLTSGTSTGTAHVTAIYGEKLEMSVDVVFQPSVPTYLEVAANPLEIPADGQTQSVITATVSDNSHRPVPDGTEVRFDIINGVGSIISPKFTNNGVATSGLSSTVVNTVTVRVSVDTLIRTVDVTCKVGSVDQIIFSDLPESIDADGVETANIEVTVRDVQGHAVEGAIVNFSATLGDITPSVQSNAFGIAVAQFSSNVVGIATIEASVGNIKSYANIKLLPGGPKSIVLTFNPNSMGVKDTGQNQTVSVSADVRDAKNNPVQDSTLVQFSIMDSPGGDETLSSYNPIPTVGGFARVSFSSGIRSGAARIRAVVVDSTGVPISPEVSSTSTELIIHAGPPYIENIVTTGYHDDLSINTHMTIAADKLNIWSTLGRATITVMVGDKYNNPVQEGTAIYLTVSGGVIETYPAYTNEKGQAEVILIGGNPQPIVDKYYNEIGMQDPNFPSKILPGFVIYEALDDTVIYNFEAFPSSWYGGYVYPSWHPDYPAFIPVDSSGFIGREQNRRGKDGYYAADNSRSYFENDGIARILAYTQGVDANNDTVRVWDWMSVVYSGAMAHASDNSINVLAGDTLHLGQSRTVIFELWDKNGNPIESNTEISAEVIPSDAAANLSWNSINTGDGMGRCYYPITITNNIDIEKPKLGPAAIVFKWQNEHQFGDMSTYEIFLDL